VKIALSGRSYHAVQVLIVPRCPSILSSVARSRTSNSLLAPRGLVLSARYKLAGTHQPSTPLPYCVAVYSEDKQQLAPGHVSNVMIRGSKPS
jgi:hypothetical protein